MIAAGVKASELVVGQAYFILTYSDTSLTVPVIRSVIYIGTDLDNEGSQERYFQDAVSYAKVGAYPNVRKTAGKRERAELIVTDADPPPNIYTIGGLAGAISQLAARAAQRAD